MAEITHITTHVSDGLSNILSQFNESDLLRKFVEIVLDEVQRLEDLDWEVLTERALDAAEGVQLDIYGQLVGWPRNGVTDDDEYRRLIKVAIQLLRHDGQAENTAYIWSQLLDGEPTVRYICHPPAHFALNWISGPDEIAQDWIDIIVPLMPYLACMGVSWELVEGTTDAFRLDDPDRGLDQGKLCRRIDTL